MINRKKTKQGVEFSVTIDGNQLPFDKWVDTDSCIYYFPLATLVDNGNALVNDQSCCIPFENIYLIDETDRAILGLPKVYNKAIRLRGEGMLNTCEFQYKLQLLTHVPDGKIIPFNRYENFIECNRKEFLLTKEQYHLFNIVDRYNSLSDNQKTKDNNFRLFSEIKALAIACHCHLDSYLSNENVFIPNQVNLQVTQDENGYAIQPTVDIEEKDKFTASFNKKRKVSDIYSVQNSEGKRTRIVLNEPQKEGLQVLKQNKEVYKSKEALKEVIENPTAFFDPEQFDLSDFFSDRVIEIGIYKPKFYPFVSPYQSTWIAGATVETPENGTSNITIEDQEALLDLENVIEMAENNQQHLIVYENTEIDINDARNLVVLAKKQFKSPDKPVKEIKDKLGREVLIIEENAEYLGFSAGNKVEFDGKYTFYKNDYLNAPFKLKAYQEEGVAWLQYLHKKSASGCLMADDMGLGKTLQILYFLDWHARTNKNHKPYLIVAPISLLENWENEYKRFFNTPRLSINRMTSRNVPRIFNQRVINNMQNMDIILTNYESMRNSQLNFCAVEFDLVILDEAQKIKTPGTLVTNAAKALKANFKIAMTGTPVENTLLDLWCIMDFCVPGLLGNAKDFAQKFQNPLKEENTDLIALGKDIHDILGLYMMRRLKEDVAKDLPMKFEYKKEVEMSHLQETAYQAVVNHYLEGIQPNMLVTIMDIRRISEHPFLYNNTLILHTTAEIIEDSARLQATMQFVEHIKMKEEKVILFAERKDTQKMLQTLIWSTYKVAAKIINGDTPSLKTLNNRNIETRQASIDSFQSVEGFNVIIMSPIAAGMGLNVTGANHVIHYSRHWNPAKESQATDRVYRIGQLKDVCVYYPMAISKKFKSFDLTLDELLTRKTTLATSTIFPTERAEVTQNELGNILFNH